jgi:aldose 1-epimerase
VNAPSLTATGARGVTRAPFGVDRDGQAVECFTLRNATGAEVEVLSLGGIIRALRVPDRDGVFGDVVLGFDDAAAYQEGTFYLGALIGRYANRLAHGAFALDGTTYHVTTNDGVNALHGGREGFDKRHWQVEPFLHDHAVGVTLRLTSADGDQGFPGELQVVVSYTWRDDCALVVDYRATTTAPTPVNLTQHSYFNLSGVDGSAVLDHELTVHASRYTPVDAMLIPTGELPPVDGTPFDFRFPRRLGERIRERDAQLRTGSGYDHNWALDHASGARVEAARLRDPKSGRLLVISTTEPGLQVYSGNHLGVGRTGKGGAPIVKHGGVAMETQHFPDAPNQSAFPSTIVRPGMPFTSSTVFAFRVEG